MVIMTLLGCVFLLLLSYFQFAIGAVFLVYASPGASWALRFFAYIFFYEYLSVLVVHQNNPRQETPPVYALAQTWLEIKYTANTDIARHALLCGATFCYMMSAQRRHQAAHD